jgi:tRNA pseudouridine32 synthase/23S rRNA pseudouridine746 synthase
MQSRLHLPKLDPAPKTILDHLIHHFPQIPAQTWRERAARGRITIDDGTVVTADSPYRHGVTVFYSREVPDEPSSDVNETILYQDVNILVADKPHGMVVTPSGASQANLKVRANDATDIVSVAGQLGLDDELAILGGQLPAGDLAVAQAA